MITGFGWASYEVMGFFFAAHNHYLQLWFELGIVGLLSYLLLIRSLLIVARRSAEVAPHDAARHLIAFVYGIIALSGALVFSVIYRPWLYVWMYAGLSMRLAVLATQSAQLDSASKERSAHRPALASVQRSPTPSARTSARSLQSRKRKGFPD
jgi:O-antigen ligase